MSLSSQVTQADEQIIEQKMNQLIKLLKDPQPAKVESYINTQLDKNLLEAYPMSDHLEYYNETIGSIGSFEVVNIQNTMGSDFNLDLKTSGGKIKRFLVEFHPNPPHGLMGMQQSPYTSFDDLQISDYQLLHNALQEKADNNEFSGNLLIAQNDNILFNHAYGYADKRFGVKNTLETRFNLASITKDFTALAILQLSQAKKLSLDDLIGKYIPEFPDSKGQKISIRHLLTHQSGLDQSFSDPVFVKLKHQMNDIEDYIDIIKDDELLFEPGTGSEYSNDGFEILGVIVQRVSGMSYYDYVRQHIFEKLNMMDSGYIQVSLAQKNMARNYTNLSALGPDEGFLRETLYMFPAIGSASGGAYSTTADMLTYMNAIESGKLLDDYHQSLFLNRFREPDDEQKNSTGKGGAGGAPGVSTYYVVNFNLGVKIVILSNYDERLAEDMAVHLYKQFKDAKKTN